MRNRAILPVFLLTCLFLAGCIGVETTVTLPARPPAAAAPAGDLSARPQDATAAPAATNTLDIHATAAARQTSFPATNEARRTSIPATAAARRTEEARRHTAMLKTGEVLEKTRVVEYHQTLTAIERTLRATVTPRVFQSMPSPDGRHLAEVILHDCARIQPPPESTYAFEQLRIDSHIIEIQFLQCGGLGGGGLGGHFWSRDSRFFYYTNAREGWPDGGYPWRRPISRYDTTTGHTAKLGLATYSPTGAHIAGEQDGSLVVWEVEGDGEVRFVSPDDPGWINWLVWSPDSRALVYLYQTNCQDSYPCPSMLIRVDLETQLQETLLGADDPPMLAVEWPRPGVLALTGADFTSRWQYDLASGTLSPAPETSATATPAPTRTPAPTYLPDPAFPEAVYPPARPFLEEPFSANMWITGYGCPNPAGLESAEPTAETVESAIETVRSGDLYLLRRRSDPAYWPATGLSLAWASGGVSPSQITITPASESPRAGLIERACGPEALAASWHAQVNGLDPNDEFFLIRRGGRWLVWMSLHEYEQ